jgi:hypothetical protein
VDSVCHDGIEGDEKEDRIDPVHVVYRCGDKIDKLVVRGRKRIFVHSGYPVR